MRKKECIVGKYMCIWLTELKKKKEKLIHMVSKVERTDFHHLFSFSLLALSVLCAFVTRQCCMKEVREIPQEAERFMR